MLSNKKAPFDFLKTVLAELMIQWFEFNEDPLIPLVVICPISDFRVSSLPYAWLDIRERQIEDVTVIAF